MQNYHKVYASSLVNPEIFWSEQTYLVDWIAKPQVILDRSAAPLYRWFPGATLNTCYNALDRHVIAGRADQPASVFDSAMTGETMRFSYAELLSETAAFAGALRELGVSYGDRVIIYLPMIPEAVIAMLACARLGAVHSVVFGGFAPPELAARIDHATPKVIVTASCGLEPGRVIEYQPMIEDALRLAEHQPANVIVKQRAQASFNLRRDRDLDWDDAMRFGRLDPAECVEVKATDPLYILYTSGTTGKPKGIIRDNGGHAVAMAWSLPNIYGCGAGDVWWAASDVGWVVGHSYLVYSPLINGATTVIYEGKPVGTPDAGAFWRVLSDYGIRAMFTAPTAIRAIRREDPDGSLMTHYNLSRLETLFLAGERLDPDTYQWVTQKLGVPVIDNWWQTETGWPIAASPRGMSPELVIKPGSPSVPMPGFDVRVLDEKGRQAPTGTDGALCLRLPMPPGTLPTLWQADERYTHEYLSTFEGYYLSGDSGSVDADGYLYVMGRTDDTINVAGHRLSTGSMEAVLVAHPDVAECAVIGLADPLKGQVPCGFVVLKAGVDRAHSEVEAELIQTVRDQMGPVAAFKRAEIVPALPKTRSGKILRRTMREIADGRDSLPPSTIEDLAVLENLKPFLHRS
jgi:propionyl-CoA synthetase